MTKFTTLNRHQLAGHVANLDFWLAETRHALDGLDGYRVRFERMKAAQSRFISVNPDRLDDVNNPLQVRGIVGPFRLPDDDLSTSRRQLCDALYRFLLRCFRERLLDAATLRQACEALDIGVESRDLA